MFGLSAIRMLNCQAISPVARLCRVTTMVKASGLDEIEQGDYRPLNRQNGQKRTLDKSE